MGRICIYCGIYVSKDEYGINFVSKKESWHGGCKLRDNHKEFIKDSPNTVKEKKT